jgi:3-methylcrotonyl-CoA carboxylase beta subunit
MDLEFNKNEDVNKQLVYEFNTRLKKIYLGGGEKAAPNKKKKARCLPANA